MFIRSALLAALFALALPTVATATVPIIQQDGTPYVLAGTTVLTVHTKELQRDYQLFISVPSGYAANGPPLPVVFVTDADYAFPLTRAIAARVGGHSKAIGPFILVGLSYALGDTPEYSRRRDYTPSTDASETYASDMPGRTPRFGEAEAYRRFIASSVLPLIAERYRADMARTVFVGHSYGSLLGTHILLVSPTLFSKYVLSSPSLWYDHQIMFAREKAYAASHKEMKADVFFSIGGLEVASDGDDTDMVRDTRNFDAALKAHRYAGLRTQLHLYEGKDHLDVFPDMITDALKWAVPGRK
ncbi:alpha/beta hydrolase [Undibacterium sp.]|uniref:alpha/beta hydrolase n=1 Tax=Undibacterium sp. TaxID=1914977 RepID=UPI00374DA68F